MNNHHNVKLPLFLHNFLLASFTFESNIATSYSGRDYVKNNSNHPIHSFVIKEAKLSSAQFEEFYAFFNARKGSLYSFALKDYGDFKVIDQILSTEIGTKKFKLFKTYSDDEASHIRDISLVLPDTIYLKKNGEDCDFEFLSETSEIEIEQALEEGDVLSVSFEFDIRVRFITNKIEYSYCSDGSIQLCDIILREVLDV